MSKTKIDFKKEDRKFWNTFIIIYANQKAIKNVKKKKKLNLRLIVKHIIKNRGHQTMGIINKKFFKGWWN